jgi:hypothetical protein
MKRLRAIDLSRLRFVSFILSAKMASTLTVVELNKTCYSKYDSSLLKIIGECLAAQTLEFFEDLFQTNHDRHWRQPDR